MPTDSQHSIRKTVLLALSTLAISGSVLFGVSVLGNAFSQVVASVTDYYNAMLKQELTIP
jgi:hypothetical protein